MYMMRFDMRAPGNGAPAADLYQAALEMVAWGETRGCVSTVVCEHHLSEDGYLPVPMTLASAMAARTEKLPIMVAVVLLPLYDVVRLAEEMIVLDIISRGRVGYVAAIGYRPVEYELFDVDYHRRGKIADEMLPVLLAAKSGEPFEHRGRKVQLTPKPFTPGGPMVGWGGGSLPAARRAGRHGIPFMAQKGDPELRVAYEAAARAAGHEPGLCNLPDANSPSTVFVADDVDQAWEELGPYLMNDVLGYGKWNEGNEGVASVSFSQTAEELRAEDRSHKVLSVDEAIAFVRGGAPLPLHPLIGGLPPQLAWPYLERVVERVLPALQA